MDLLRHFAPFAIAFCASSTSAFAGFKCPAKGGSEWREYRTAHFDIFSDASDFNIDRLVERLETMHVLEVQALVGEQVEIPGKLRVIALASPSLFTDLAGRSQISGYYKRSPFGEPTIVLPVEAADHDAQTVAHEVAHHISGFFFVRQPAWFSEGLAEFLQTLGLVEPRIESGLGSHIVRGGRDHNGAIGAVPSSMVAALQEAPRVSLKELFEWNGAEERAGASYHLYGWLLYHWLWNTRSKDLSAFQQRLSNGEGPAAAWRATFPDLDPGEASSAAKVDDALDRYRRSGRYVTYKVQAKADTSFRKLAAIASADVHMLMHDAANAWDKNERLANLDEALGEDASQPAAVVLRAGLDKSSPVERLRKSVAARPGDWRAWLSLGDALSGEAKVEKEAALRKAVALNPDSARAHNGLAWLLVTDGRAKEALPVANRALDLAPGNPAIVDTLALVAARLGKCADALVLERRAATMVPVGSEMELSFRKRIAEYEAQCGKVVPAAASAVSPR